MLKPVLKNSTALLVQYGAQALVPLLLVPHVARTIGLEAFGVLSVMLAWATYGTTVVAYSFHMTGPARVAAEPSCVPKLVATVLAARGALALAAIPVLLAAYAAGLMPPATLPAALLILITLPIASALNTSWHLQAVDRFMAVSVTAVAGTLLTLWLGLTLVGSADATSVTWAAAALVAGTLVVGIGSFALSLHAMGRLPRVRWSEVRLALGEGRALFASQIVALAYAGSGPILIGWLSDLQQAGTYGVLDRLVTSIYGAALLVHTAAYPILARLFHSDRRAYLKLAGLVTAAYVLAGTCIAAIAWNFRDPVLAYLYGTAGPRPYALYLLGLAWITCGIFGSVVTGYFVVSGQHRQVYRLTWAVLVTSLLLGVPGVLLYGAAGWMAGLLGGQTLVVVSAFQQWRKEHGRGAL